MATELSLVFSDLVDGRITADQARRQYDIQMDIHKGEKRACRHVVLDVLNHQFFTAIVSLVAILSVIVTLNGIDSDRPVSRNTLHFNYAAAAFFACECAARMISMGPRKYFSNILCLVELSVSFLDAILFIILFAYGANYKKVAQMGRTLRVIRLLRIIRLVRLARFVGQNSNRLYDVGLFLKQPRLFKRVRKRLFQNQAKGFLVALKVASFFATIIFYLHASCSTPIFVRMVPADKVTFEIFVTVVFVLNCWAMWTCILSFFSKTNRQRLLLLPKLETQFLDAFFKGFHKGTFMVSYAWGDDREHGVENHIARTIAQLMPRCW
jgi:hypothetical protein